MIPSSLAAKRAARPKLTSLSDIYGYFRRNDTPIYFLSPTPYNLLGLGRWVNKFEYINFFDSFDGSHPKITVPREHGPHEFRSIEDVNNYLLRHREVRHHIEKRGKGHLILVMLDEETEALAKELGLKIMLPPVKLMRCTPSNAPVTSTFLKLAARLVPPSDTAATDLGPMRLAPVTSSVPVPRPTYTPYSPSSGA